MRRRDGVTSCGATSPAFRARPGDQRHPCTLQSGHVERLHVHRDRDGRVTARWTDPLDPKGAARSW